MTSTDILKLIILLGLYGFFAPLTAFLIRNSHKAQRVCVAIMCFMTTGGIMAAAEWGLTIAPFLYRSHARGYHFYFITFPAVVLILAKLFKNWRESKIIPPGFWLFYVFCVSSCLSIFIAQYPTYVLMALLKTAQITLVGIATYNFIRDEADLKFLLHWMAITMVWQLIVVLKLKYVHGVYQVYGTFEHQNSLSTFTTMIGLAFLGAALGPKEEKSNWFLLVYIFCAFIVQSTFSRGSLAMFAFGTVIVVALSILDRVTKRRMIVLGCLSLVAVIGLAFTLDTIMARFNDYGNTESKNTREQLNEASRRMVADYPLGVGWNNYGRMLNHPNRYGDHIDAYYLSLGIKLDKSYQKGISESLYYLTLAENGYQSLALLLAFFALFLYYNIRAAYVFRTQFIGGLSIGLLAGCGVIYIQSILERVLTQPRNMALWFLLLGAAARIETWRREEVAARRRESERPPSQWEQNQLASLSEPLAEAR